MMAANAPRARVRAPLAVAHGMGAIVMGMMNAMTRDDIYGRIVEILATSFELEKDEIKLESTLYEELDLDSIDAIDIFVQLRELTGRRPDPADARKIRTVAELVEFVETEIAKGPEEGDPGAPPDPRELFGAGGD